MTGRFLIIGPPGAGKGTQAARLSTLFGIPAIATGDIFRYNIKNETPLGKEVKSIVDAGDYVPDSLTNELVRSRLEVISLSIPTTRVGWPCSSRINRP